MNTTELTHKNLVKKFHMLLSKYSIRNEDKLTILGTYGVETSLDLTIDELAQVCDAIQATFGAKEVEKQQELDKLRKRLIASIYAWRKAMGCATTMNEVKGIACNAAQTTRFNDITKERLQSLYYAFRNKTKDLNNIAEMTDDMIDYLTLLN